MKPEREALLQLFDRWRAAGKTEAGRLATLLESHLDDLQTEFPNVPRKQLRKTVEIAYRRWMRAQEKTSTLPPQA